MDTKLLIISLIYIAVVVTLFHPRGGLCTRYWRKKGQLPNVPPYC